MADIVFPISTAPGNRPGEGAGRLVNCYAEKLEEGARASFVRRRAPGLRRIVQAPYVGCRGMHFFNGTLFVALADKLVKVTRSGTTYTAAELGDLPGEKRVSFARNNKAPVPDILTVTENDVYVVTDSAAPTSLGDGDLPQPLAVDFIDGYFVFPIRDGRYFVSGINDTTISALDFGKAESRSGGIFNAVAYGEQLLLMGTSSIEVWQNAGNATGTPFSRAAVIPRGLASTFAIGGNADGYAAVVFVGDDNGVYLLDGSYTPGKISTPDLERLIAAVTDKATIDVTVGITPGHQWATITGPSFSWTFDLATKLWHERKSFRWPNWRGICSVKAWDDKWVIGDRETGDIWLLDADYQREGDAQLVARIESLPVPGFPNRAIFPRADFDLIVGQGLVAGEQPIETDPVVLISWSDDGGQFFGNPVSRELGRNAQYKRRVSVNRTGMATPYGRVWRLEVADPVYVGFLRGSHEIAPVSR